MKKVLNLIKHNKIMTIVIILLLIFVIFIATYIFRSNHGGIYGDRCKDHEKHQISKSKINKVKEVINNVGDVNDIEIYTKLCTIKIIINLSEDIEIDKIKQMGTDILSEFSEKELKYYDFSLYVTSDNKDSETYPVNVSRHKTSDNFAW